MDNFVAACESCIRQQGLLLPFVGKVSDYAINRRHRDKPT